MAFLVLAGRSAPPGYYVTALAEVRVTLGHQRRYTKRSLATSCEEAGWHVLFLRYFNPIGALTWFLSGKILRRSAIAQWQTRAIELAVPTLKAVDRLFGGRGLGQSLIAIAEPEERPHA